MNADSRQGLRVHRGQLGVMNSMESVMRFLRWADSYRGELSMVAVKEYLGCSRATAYRWLNAFNASKGKP